MHVHFDPDSVDWQVFLVQRGGGAYFVGQPYQRGYGIGSVLSGLFRFLLPTLKSVGRELGREGLNVGAKVLGELAQGKNIRNTLVDETSEGLRQLIDRADPKESLKKLVTQAQTRLQKGSGGKGHFGSKRRPQMPSKRPPVSRSAPAKRPARRGRRVDYLGYH